MLRIIQNTSAQGAKSYYTDALTKGDYYTKNHPQEIIGNWGGKIAKDLGIVGQVDQKRFESLVDNVHPETGIQLNPRTNNFRRVGYDFNFHCPKSVSVVYALQKDDSILAAFRESVQEAMQEVESEMKTRVRKNHQNDDRQTGNMLWAEFVHTTARPVNKVPDPHLHAHCFSFNTTYDSEEQRFKAGQFGDIKRDAPYYEAVFHAHFSKKLADLGYPIKRTDKGWELAGVPQSLIDKFSRRTEEIEKIAKEQGVTSAQKKDKLGAKTREKKQEELDQKQLENTWMNRLNASERLALTRVKSVSMHHISARDSVNHAINHMFERSSVVDRKRMAAQAMSAGYGSVSVAEMKNTLGRSSLITKTFENQTLCTTREALAEEKQITLLARAGRGQCAPFMGKVDNFSHKKLSAEQNAAIKHILYSQDQVVGISGKAGTGKTTLMQATVKAIEKSGKKVYTFAPSAEASRGVLRSEGFKQAETVATLLKNKEWQGKVKGQVIWIDESGLLSNRQMQELLSLAHQSHTRIILSGDDLQHKSVERGDAQRIVQDYAGIKFAQIEMIRRQQGAYKDAVEELSNGNISQGMDTLDQMGAVRECADDKRYEQLAEEYARLVRQKKSVLVVSPTHQEGAITTTHIRTVLRKTGKLGKSEKKINQQRNLQLTMAERMNPEQYHNSQVIQFHQNTTGFKAGEKAIVVKRTHNSIVVKNVQGKTKHLPLHQAGRFQVYEKQELALAKGDMIRITQNGKTKDGKHRVNNGAVYQVKGFTQTGDVKLTNEWVIDKKFSNLAYGYVTTSHASQGKTVDHVLIAQSSTSLGASSKEQLYVSASRGRRGITIYTDDKEELLHAVSKSPERMTATELVSSNHTVPPDLATRHALQVARLHDHHKRITYGHESVVKHYGSKPHLNQKQKQEQEYELSRDIG